MRKASTLVALSLVALTATARAQGPAPAAAPAPPPEAAPASVPMAVPAAPTPPPTTAPAAVAAPPPAAAAPVLVLPATTPEQPRRPIQLGVSLLAMGLGNFTSTPGGMTMKADAAFSYGFGLSAGYEVVRGLTLGIAPQVIYNVKTKDQAQAAKEADLFGRLAYSVTLVETIALYVEALPGYSLIIPPAGATAKGLVLDFGGGCMMDVGDRTYVNIGVGYELGFQKVNISGRTVDAKTDYVRVALGAGMKF